MQTLNISVLIVEDNEAKLNSIKTALEREFNSISVYTAQSVHSGINAIFNVLPAIIIADMSLPTYDIKVHERGGTPRPFGGIEIFETLECNSLLTPVIVVTSYEAISDGEKSVNLSELEKSLSKDFPENYLGCVYFDSTYLKWEHELINYCSDVLREKYAT